MKEFVLTPSLAGSTSTESQNEGGMKTFGFSIPSTRSKKLWKEEIVLASGSIWGWWLFLCLKILLQWSLGVI